MPTARTPQRWLTVPPTPRQLEVLRIVYEHTQLDGMAPTHRWLGEMLGAISTNAVACLLEALERRGLLTSAPGKARSLVVTPEGLRALGVATVAQQLASVCAALRVA